MQKDKRLGKNFAAAIHGNNLGTGTNLTEKRD
jgi:hypothetical protein